MEQLSKNTKKSITVILSFGILLGISFVNSCKLSQVKTTQSIEPEKTMYVNGRFLYTAADEKVILRGVNEMMIWSNDKTGATIFPEIAKTGANSMLLFWTTEGDPLDLDLMIKNCIKNEMIPVLELHDATGDWSKFQMVMDYWLRKDVIKVIKKHEKWLIVNIANEVGGTVTPDSLFVNTYRKAIIDLRKAGYRMPLMIDASDWGKDEKIIIRNWKKLQNCDSLKNVMFSVHTYWAEKNMEERIDNLIETVVKDTIPFLFAEGPEPYGWDCKTVFPFVEAPYKKIFFPIEFFFFLKKIYFFFF